MPLVGGKHHDPFEQRVAWLIQQICHQINDLVLIPRTDHHLRRINLADNKVAGDYQGHTDWVLSSAIDPTRTNIASGAFNGEVRIWKLADGSLVNSWIAKP